MEQYKTKILPMLKKELGVGNDLEVPKLEKIVVNVGVGKFLQQNPKGLEEIRKILGEITGQNPAVRVASKSIAGFKVREGQVVGLAVTLRGKRMYDFLDRLIHTALPRSRDFRGVSSSGFDGFGNFSMGIKEYVIFPELIEAKLEGSLGLEITLVTTIADDAGAKALLQSFGFPFSKEDGTGL